MTQTQDQPVPSMTAIFWVSLLCIGLLAGGIRLHALGSTPQRFNQDEMLLGYDAWSLWQTGRDHHGELLPINFRAYNDYVPPVATYLAAPFVGLLGLSEATTRLSFALMGIGTVLCTGLLARKWFGPAAGLVAALFLAVDPWHVNYSRIAFPASCVPFFIVLALYAFTQAIAGLARSDEAQPTTTRQPRFTVGWLIASALFFGLLTATYPTMKIEAPLLFAACAIAAFPQFLKHCRLFALWTVCYALSVSPLLIAQLSQWSTIQMHYNSISIFNSADWLAQAARLYIEHFNLIALALTGFAGGVSIRLPNAIGEVFWLEAPLWIVALIALARPDAHRVRAMSLGLLIGFWLLTYPVADSLTRGDSSTDVIGHPHEIRSLNLLPLPELLAAYGAVQIERILSRRRGGRAVRNILTIAGGASLVVFTIISLAYYFNPPPVSADALPYNIGLGAVLNSVLTDAHPCDNIWLQTGNQTYMYFLFLTHYPPGRVQQFDLSHVNSSGVLEIAGFDRMSFSEPDINHPIPPNRPECAGQPQRAYYVTKSDKSFPGWQELIAIRDSSNGLIWRALVK